MLLAAQMSSEVEHSHYKDELFKASKIQKFFDSIRKTIIEYGTIRRSQTLLGSTVGAINEPNQWVIQEVKSYQKLTETISKKHQTFKKDISKSKLVAQEFLQQQIKVIFQDAFNAILPFAEEHWKDNEQGLTRGWEKQLKSIKFEERLRSVFKKAGEKFNQEVQEDLEAIGHELTLFAQLGGGSFSFFQQDSDVFVKNLFKIGGSLLGVAGAILFFTPFAPAGLFIGIVGGVISFISGWFKSQEQKRREAVQNISTFLSDHLNQQQKEILEKAEINFNQYCADVANNIDNYFDQLTKGLEDIVQTFEVAAQELDQTSDYLNRAYAKRIIDWCNKEYKSLTEEEINKTIAKLERDFSNNMIITTQVKLDLNINEIQLKRVLQEDIVIVAIAKEPPAIISPKDNQSDKDNKKASPLYSHPESLPEKVRDLVIASKTSGCLLKCPICEAQVKARNLVKHFDKTHKNTSRISKVQTPSYTSKSVRRE